jgi:hypothetical protein
MKPFIAILFVIGLIGLVVYGLGSTGLAVVIGLIGFGSLCVVLIPALLRWLGQPPAQHEESLRIYREVYVPAQQTAAPASMPTETCPRSVKLLLNFVAFLGGLAIVILALWTFSGWLWSSVVGPLLGLLIVIWVLFPGLILAPLFGLLILIAVSLAANESENNQRRIIREELNRQ